MQGASAASPFDLDDDASYRRWREWKLRCRPAGVAALTVPLADPRALAPAEREALLQRIAQAGCALYRSPLRMADKDLPRRLGAQLGLHALDANWLADEDGISSIAVSARTDAADAGDAADAADAAEVGEGRAGFIPYTDRAIRWHTDGYYHPPGRLIRGMILHCVQPAAQGGATALLDPELLYIALRGEDPALVRALMQPDAMTIPARSDEAGVARAAQSGPVFSVCDDGQLHLRYTARTRSIEWKDDAATRAAQARLVALLEGDGIGVLRLCLEAGMGIVGHNVLHERSAIVDDPALPRLLYRARYLDRVRSPHDEAWR